MVAQESIKAPEKLYTIADLEAMPGDGTRRELVEGRLIEMPGAKPNHNLLAFLIAKLLDSYAAQLHSGVVIPELGCQFTHDPDTIMFPDVGYVSFERLGSHDMREYLPFAPDLAIEIMLPSNTSDEIGNKIDWYQRFGARLMWVVYPKTRKVYVYNTSKSPIVHDRNDVLDGGSMLPGFMLPMSDLFPSA